MEPSAPRVPVVHEAGRALVAVAFLRRNFRLGFLLLLALTDGLRPDELRGLTARDLYMQDGALYVVIRHEILKVSWVARVSDQSFVVADPAVVTVVEWVLTSAPGLRARL